MTRIIFGAAEDVKDGLLALAEYLGHSPWSERMVEIVDDIWEYIYNTNYSVYMLDNHEPYRDAILKVFSNLSNYVNFDWKSGSAGESLRVGTVTVILPVQQYCTVYGKLSR